MEKTAKIYVAGHRGMVGSAITRALRARGYGNLITVPHAELDLTDPAEVNAFFASAQPEYIFLAAARVGGIQANIQFPVDFLLKNTYISCNVIQSAYLHHAKKLLFIGSSCAYPKAAPQPICEESLLTGPFEPTNEGFAVSKMVGIKLCSAYQKQYGADFISVMPCNLYGYNDSFDLTHSHLAAALLRNFHSAKEKGDAAVTIWGTGEARRELMFADDFADAAVFLMENYSGGMAINAGYGTDYSVMEIAQMVKRVTGFTGEIRTDPARPDGMARKLLDSSKLRALGWRPKTPLEEGLSKTYDWYLKNKRQ